MRRHLSIRWKVLAVLALPVLILALAGGALAYDALAQAQARRQLGAFAEAQSQVNAVIAALQAERLATVGTGADRATALMQARAQTSRELTRLDLTLAETGVSDGVPGAATVVSRLDAAHFRLAEQRRLVDTDPSGETVLDGYASIITADVELPGEMAAVLSDRLLAQRFTAATELARANEAASRMHLIGLTMIRAGQATQDQQNQLAVAIAAHDGALAAFAGSGTVVDQAITAQAAAAAEPFSGLANDLQRRQSLPIGLPEATWTTFADGQSAALRRMATEVTRDAAAQAESSAEVAQQRVTITSAVAVALVGLMILLALMQSRQITAPLRRLAQVTTRTREELPEAVESIIVHGASSADLPVVEVGAKDEVGDVAAAFRDVQATVIGIAHEQASLRGALAETFVNVARRNQVLLARQLSFIDRLERSEENAEALENLFRLDHLATRMRRNAESLLVLAGIDAGRRARSPMPLSDVIRTAISEIEHYDRVDLDSTVNPLVVAHLALPSAHLVAELIENATLFSEPSSRVWVLAAAGPEGVEVTVVDSGLGMSAEELAEANHRVADAETSTAVPVHTQGASRLGLYVVARLAARLGARVRLSAGEAGGTVVKVVLGSSVFVEGSAPSSSGVIHRIDVADAERREDDLVAGQQDLPVEPFVVPPARPPEDPSFDSSFDPSFDTTQSVAGWDDAVTDEMPVLSDVSPDEPEPLLPALEPESSLEPAVPADLDPSRPLPLPRRRPGGRTPPPPEPATVLPTPPGFVPVDDVTTFSVPAQSVVDPDVAHVVDPAGGESDPAEPAPADSVADSAADQAPRATIAATMDVLPNGGRGARSRGFFGRRSRERAAVRADPPLGVPMPSKGPAPDQAPSGWLAGEAPDDGTRWGWAQQSDTSGLESAAAATSRADMSRSELTSSALSELSMLSSYRPAVGDGSPATLVRRRPSSPPLESPAAPPATIGPVRPVRTAEGVRATLSGFVSGAALGRGRGGVGGFDPRPASDPTATTEEDHR